MTEIVEIAFDHQGARVDNITTKKKGDELSGLEQTSGCLTVCNRTLINKVIYTYEDAPEMVFIHVPPI